MTSKKTAANKRTNLPLASDYTKMFSKDWKKLSRSGRYDMNKLKQVMLSLIENSDPLGAEFKDHALAGNWSGYRECHIGGDFLLIYMLEPEKEPTQILFVRTGTHSELF